MYITELLDIFTDSKCRVQLSITNVFKQYFTLLSYKNIPVTPVKLQSIIVVASTI